MECVAIDILAEYNSKPPASRDYKKKDGALVAMAALSKVKTLCDCVYVC